MNTTLIQSHVRHGEKWFFVSTINRESSAVEAYGMTYAETMAWAFDFETKKRGDFIWQGEGPTDSLRAHFRICEKLAKTGKFEDDES